MNDVERALAKEHFLAYRNAERLAVCDVALSEDPDDADAHRARASALGVMGRHLEAVDAFTRAIECDCRLGDLYQRAAIWIQLDELDRAIDDARRLIDLGAEEEDDSFRDGAFIMLAVAYHYQGRPELCRAACAEVPTDTVWHCKGKLHTVAMLLESA